jgi:hypothetical protein
MIDYSLFEDSAGRLVRVPMVRGRLWPAGGRNLALRLELPDGSWTPGVEDAWTWRLRLDDRAAGGTADLSLTASGAAIGGDADQYLDLEFSASADQSAGVAGSGAVTVQVDLESETGAGAVSVWPEAHGKLSVRDAVGGG